MTDQPGAVRRCPNCGKPREQAFRPFCSRTCRDRDFLAWADGRYAIPAVENTEDDVDQPPSGRDVQQEE